MKRFMFSGYNNRSTSEPEKVNSIRIRVYKELIKEGKDIKIEIKAPKGCVSDTVVVTIEDKLLFVCNCGDRKAQAIQIFALGFAVEPIVIHDKAMAVADEEMGEGIYSTKSAFEIVAGIVKGILEYADDDDFEEDLACAINEFHSETYANLYV